MASVWGELKRRNVVRVGVAYLIVGWLLLQVADVVLNNTEAPAWVFQSILLLLIIGFPLALIFAWAFELTPEGIKKEKDVDRSQSVTHLTGRKLDFAIIGLMAAVILYLVADNYVLEQAPSDAASEVADKSIAVLPFVALSSGEDDGYFADGLTEEILNALAQLPELQVTARTSSFFFKGQNIPVPEIAERLDVAQIVEGSVRRDGERVRITAQLIRASDGFHLWSQSYDRSLEDIFLVQEDIAENIAEVLGVVLDDNAWRVMRRIGIRDVEAFIAYQKGLEAFATAHGSVFISEALGIANVYFDQALAVAPNLTDARVMKADRGGHIIVEIASGYRDEQYPGESQDALTALREEYNEAWRLSPPGNQRDILDVERTFFTEDWSTLPDRLKKAMQPGECTQMNWTAEIVGPFGWARRLVEKTRQMLACDPVNFGASYNLPFLLVMDGDPDAAVHFVDEAENMGASHPWLDDGRFIALLAAGRVDDPALRGPSPDGSMFLNIRPILREGVAGDPGVARRLAEEYWAGPESIRWHSILLAAAVGDRERANEFAARIDAVPGSAVVLNLTLLTCVCGAPFDLDAAPNFKSRIEEAGFSWPPATRVNYPAKTW